jgi:glycerophosphoryl diester phosphodiesterase
MRTSMPHHRTAWLAALTLLAAPYSYSATRACAHRGDNEQAPENTVPAILSAVRKGAPQIEFDVKLSRDGQLAVLHDRTLDRTSNGKGNIADFTFVQLRGFDFGSWFSPKFAGTRIPSLREVVAAIPPGILMNVHLDSAPGVALRAARAIDEMGRLAGALFASTEEQAGEIRAAFPRARICNMSRQDGGLAAYVDRTIGRRADFIQLRDAAGHSIPEGLAEAVAKLHRHGVSVNYFGAQDERKIRALAQAQVDYVLTDKLDLCMKVLAQ